MCVLTKSMGQSLAAQKARNESIHWTAEVDGPPTFNAGPTAFTAAAVAL